MFRYSPVFAALALSLMSSAFVPSLKASETDKKTVITVSQAIAVEETVLPAGKYVLKLLSSSSSRDVVQIYNAKETELITTILAIPAYRLRPTGETMFSFYEAPAGQPSGLHTWFYPGDNSGFEFLQSHHAASLEPSAAGN
jgi:hypothetical protein